MIYKKILLPILVATTLITYIYLLHTRPQQQTIQSAFQAFVTKYHKHYTYHEKEYRFKIFEKKYIWIKQHNALRQQGVYSFSVAINKFSDLTKQQYKELYLRSFKRSNSITNFCNSTIEDTPKPPEEVDWSRKAATQVQDQGKCGSSWAFSATGAIQGLIALNKGRLIKLSDQQLLDCSTGDYGNQGCGGGFMDQAFWYVMDNGIALDQDYPYVGTNNACKYKPASKYAQFKECAEVPIGNYTKMLSAVIQQPVSAAVDASSDQFISYSDGIFNGPCGSDVNRGIVVVGYGFDSDQQMAYWRIKNSIGTDWGMQGFMLLKRDRENPQIQDGQCGLYLVATIPKSAL